MDPAMSTFPPPYTIPTIFSWKRIQASCMLQKLWNSTTLQTEFLKNDDQRTIFLERSTLE
jgi:hypothetical protein